jgi:hypothetical protein
VTEKEVPGQGRRARPDVLITLRLGERAPETERLPFTYASYDPRDDAPMIGLGGTTARFPVLLRHLINHPAEVDFAVPRPNETDVRVVGDDATETILGLRPQPARPE